MTGKPHPTEIELKLELSENGIEALLASGLLGEAAERKALRAIYFDTPDHTLAAEGLSLRVRESGAKRMQTIKADRGSAGLFDRGEWELAVDGLQPVPDDRAPVGTLLEGRLDVLFPVFEVPIERHTARRGGIEIALDRGEAVAGERRETIREVELELLDGDPAALFTLARAIDKVTPVRIGVLAKAERGYRLLGEHLPSVRADKVRLDPQASLAEAFAQIAMGCLRQYRLNEAILLDQPGPEAIHQARVALRRLRSAMTLFKDVLGPERKKLGNRLRDLGQVLGAARDLDVLSARIAPGPLLDSLTEARGKAYAAMARKLKGKATRRLPLDLAEWIALGFWRSDPETARLRETPLKVFAAKALDLRLDTIREDGRHLADLDPEERHQVRKDAKKLRYAVDYLGSLFKAEKKDLKVFRRALKDLQEALGALNDKAAAEETLALLGLDQTPEGQAFLAGDEQDFDAMLDDAVKTRRALLDAPLFWDAPLEA